MSQWIALCCRPGHPTTSSKVRVASTTGAKTVLRNVGERFSTSTHRSSQDSDACLARRSKAHPALLSVLDHILMDNRYHQAADSTYPKNTI